MILSVFLIFSRALGLANREGSVVILKKIGVWLLIFLLIITAYAFKSELSTISERVIATIMPSYVVDDSTKHKLTISRSQDKHFYIQVKINNKKIKFMIDTGASDVAISARDAIALGINLSNLHYTKEYSTANGITLAAPIILDKVEIGPVEFNKVKAHINKGDLDVSLLGMSLISRFKSFTIDSDLLILEY